VNLSKDQIAIVKECGYNRPEYIVSACDALLGTGGQVREYVRQDIEMGTEVLRGNL
jgi:hypothetical protein